MEQKAKAEAEAKAAAEAEAAYKAQQTSQQQTVAASANTTFAAQVQATSTSSSSSDDDSSYTPAATTVSQRPTYSSNASSYPVGQCTWGAKTLAPWAGDYWGNGGQWATSAAAAGFRTDPTASRGTVRYIYPN